MEQKTSRLGILTNGILKENPTLVLVLGTCPTLAVSTMAVNGIGMGAAATAVLVFSNIIIALLKDVIPEKVRIPCYIVVIASLVTVVQLVVQAFFPDIYDALGIFLPLIVVNCIILGRAEMFASKNSVLNAALDGIGMGIGFTLALTFIGCVREIIGSGSVFGVSLESLIALCAANGQGALAKGITAIRDFLVNIGANPMTLFLLAPGGFFIYGLTIALVNRVTKGKGVKRKSFGCEGCPSAAVCGRKGKIEEGGAKA